MDDETLTGINIVKGQMQGDEFLFDYEEIDERGVPHLGVWKSSLDKDKADNDGRVLED